MFGGSNGINPYFNKCILYNYSMLVGETGLFWLEASLLPLSRCNFDIYWCYEEKIICIIHSNRIKI